MNFEKHLESIKDKSLLKASNNADMEAEIKFPEIDTTIKKTIGNTRLFCQ